VHRAGDLPVGHEAGGEPVAGGVVAAVVAPFFFYPFSKTIWVALELILRPAESHEPTDNR
jgi:hypothetical protein